jgi:hypothetical protein
VRHSAGGRASWQTREKPAVGTALNVCRSTAPAPRPTGAQSRAFAPTAPAFAASLR